VSPISPFLYEEACALGPFQGALARSKFESYQARGAETFLSYRDELSLRIAMLFTQAIRFGARESPSTFRSVYLTLFTGGHSCLRSLLFPIRWSWIPTHPSAFFFFCRVLDTGSRDRHAPFCDSETKIFPLCTLLLFPGLG